MDGLNDLEVLFRHLRGKSPDRVEKITGSGSNRKYFRMIDCSGEAFVGVIGEDPAENKAFVGIASHLSSKGIPVPEVMAVSDDCKVYIQEDLGRTSLYDAVASGRKTGEYSETEAALLEKAVRYLPAIAVTGADGFDFGRHCFSRPFDKRSVYYDLNYFKYCFLKLEGIPFDEDRLEDDFGRLSALLLSSRCDYFMYRDFQSRNVMLKAGEPYFIDFQGARRGPAEYDLASFVWQARASYGNELRKRLVNAYLEEMSRYEEVDRECFAARLRTFVFFRMLQVLGAYGYRGLYERKEHFLQSIPFALENVRTLFDDSFSGYPVSSLRQHEGGDLEGAVPYLAGLLCRKVSFPDSAAPACLEVEITSFSYKNGVPQDKSGNGGGYVFDCRGILNPGRYEEYASLDGRDVPVAEFLEKKTRMPAFLENVFSIVDMHVENFLSRDFRHLFVAFGCTGGRHRSVYCAEKLAAHIAGKYVRDRKSPIKILLKHREMGE